MGKINVLDCTLRDGGYCNQWKFGEDNIRKITKGLCESGIDVIECGFINKKAAEDSGVTIFRKPSDVNAVIPSERRSTMFVVMMNYSEYDTETLEERKHGPVDGIRLAFHRKDITGALAAGREIQKKGYMLFLQPMVSLSYSDDEFLSLIHECNEMKPHAFYIVDSFGVMKRKDLVRLFCLVEHNLDDNISIGFHSHNNMQLSYSNAQVLAEMQGRHDLIIDSCVYGMGRGAGNLNTELFVEYLNDNFDGRYDLKPLLVVIDQIISKFYSENAWGYSLPNYLSAKHNTHPNYASYLDERKTLTVENMDEIFAMMDDEKRVSYDKRYIEDLYEKYMESGAEQEIRLNELQSRIEGHRVLIIAPGKSSLVEKDKVAEAARQDGVETISINFDYAYAGINFIFLSNLRRYRELDASKRNKCIVTSNIPATDVYARVKYAELLNSQEAVRDNAGMMLIRLLIQLKASEILVAGLDGYSMDATQNFADQGMNFYTQKASFDAMNAGMNKVIREFRKEIGISFVTTPKYVCF